VAGRRGRQHHALHRLPRLCCDPGTGSRRDRHRRGTCLALPDGLLAEVASAAERAWLTELAAASPGVPWDRVLFCAKEAVYKAWYSRTGQRPGLRSMTVQVAAAGTFAAALPAASLTGRWLVRDGLIVTAVTVPH
jgi:4'-phosphopantetheinyl transferase EntD